ncbi:hypothetical protein HELRODRAFT_190510 [Helobdella robusta]|uniref:Arrestin C-terminal-like domain-containing protein n=1 Tax=Helobdella robusta TaxID=6412 RepID=T1FS22_HELRO|nr:hypothetical protein HELRODRAFT_190510 [Helobdella robusta]ESO09472.1 hypothetical protein HELRODRAFT_190510 [Helobdella robusta]
MSNAIKKFEIHLDHDIDEKYQYEPGEPLSGNIVLVLGEDLFIKSIKVQIRGEAMVGLDDEDANKSPETSLRASEIYVDDIVSVFDEQKPTTLPRGNHSFPLNYVLPTNLPSSFIGKLGSITYVIKATVKQGFENQVSIGSNITSEPFLVLRQHDLKKYPELFRPKHVRLTKSSTCSFLFCNKGKLEAEFQVYKTGFLPGEDILINAQINNDYPSSIIAAQAILFLNSYFHAKNRSQQNNQIVNKKVDSLPIDYGAERTWTDFRLPVPPFIPESRLDGCVLIDIEYMLHFRLEFDDGDCAEAKIPVVIGTPVEERKKHGKGAWNEKDYPISSGDNFDFTGNAFDDINVDKKDLERFRHPMEEGETKDNILFQED